MGARTKREVPSNILIVRMGMHYPIRFYDNFFTLQYERKNTILIGSNLLID